MKSTLIGLSLVVLITAGTACNKSRSSTGQVSEPTATTQSPQEFATFVGEEWVDGHLAGDDVTAKIGNAECGSGHATNGGVEGSGRYRVTVASNEITPGCGREGSVVTFSVGARPASLTARWHAGATDAVNLLVGSPFALMWVTPALTCDQMTGKRIVPLVHGVACGEQVWPAVDTSCRGQPRFEFAVPSVEEQGGCGVEGTPISFELVDSKGDVVAIAKEGATWHAWDGVSFQPLNLTFISTTSILADNAGEG